jgi:putative addiction module killer protein
MEIRATLTFTAWLDNLRDREGRTRIARRLERLAGGAFGDVSPVGGGVSEMRLHFGPGYRVYFA